MLKALLAVMGLYTAAPAVFNYFSKKNKSIADLTGKLKDTKEGKDSLQILLDSLRSSGQIDTSKIDTSKIDTSKIDTSKLKFKKPNISKQITSVRDLHNFNLIIQGYGPSMGQKKADSIKTYLNKKYPGIFDDYDNGMLNQSQIDTSQIDTSQIDTSKINISNMPFGFTTGASQIDTSQVDSSQVDSSQVVAPVITTPDTVQASHDEFMKLLQGP